MLVVVVAVVRAAASGTEAVQESEIRSGPVVAAAAAFELVEPVAAGVTLLRPSLQ